MRKRTKGDKQKFENYIFEIKKWEPTYSFSINGTDYRDEPYSEFVEIHLDTTCVFPNKLASIETGVILSNRREYFPGLT